MNKYIRLPNGNKIKYYSFAITNALIVKFIDTDVNAIKDFFGVSIIDYMDITNENDDILESHNLYMKLKTNRLASFSVLAVRLNLFGFAVFGLRYFAWVIHSQEPFFNCLVLPSLLSFLSIFIPPISPYHFLKI